MKNSRGVALIIALVVVALATVIATRIGSQGALDQRRGANLLAHQQGFEIALGAETWAIEILKIDAATSKRTSLDGAWATPLTGLPIDGGTLSGGLEDMQGRFNLNNLVKPDGTRNDVAFAQFQRLLQALELEPKWAFLALDWIDPDNVASGPEGAEDGVYLGQSPPYRAANRPMVTTSELLALPGFGMDRYRRIAPYVAALPIGTTLNVCTAKGLVLDTLAPGVVAFSQDPKQLALNRQKGCFPAIADVQAALVGRLPQPGQLQALVQSLSETSQWFQARTLVNLGTTELTLYSLIVRNPSGSSRVVLRSLGTE
jgi:general secretion pathway protein K